MASLDPFNTRDRNKDQGRMPQYVPTAVQSAPTGRTITPNRVATERIFVPSNPMPYQPAAETDAALRQSQFFNLIRDAYVRQRPVAGPGEEGFASFERQHMSAPSSPFAPAFAPTSPLPQTGMMPPEMQQPMPNMPQQQATGAPMQLAKQPNLLQSLMRNPAARGALGFLMGGPVGALGGAGGALLGNAVNGRGFFGGEGNGKGIFGNNANAHLPSSTGPKTFVSAPMPTSNGNSPSYQYNPKTGGYGYY